MNKKYKTIFLFLIPVTLLLAGFLANAAGLVPCGGRDMPSCRLCHFLFLIRNITNYILKALMPLGILFIIIGGIIILISRNTSLAATGKRFVRIALMGIIIALAAWFIVDMVIVFLLRPGTFPFPWYAWELQCPIVKISLPNAMTSSYTLINDTDPTGVSPGDTIRYILTYTNISDQNLSNLNIMVDYDQNLVTSITNISSGGTDDEDKISWIIGSLNSGQSVTVSHDFVLTIDFLQLWNSQSKKTNQLVRVFKKLFGLLIKPASGQVSPFVNVYYRNVVTVTSNEAESETLNDPLQIKLPNTIFTNRNYYLIKDSADDKLPSPGDELRYNINYFNPTLLSFSNVVIISDYDQDSITIGRIDGGGIDDGDRIIWNLGNLPVGQPTPNNPGCIGYNFTIKTYGSWYFGQFTANIFYIMASGGILETHNDAF